MIPNLCHHHCCQNLQLLGDLFCANHQTCLHPTCHRQKEKGSFYCLEHQLRTSHVPASQTKLDEAIAIAVTNTLIALGDEPPSQPLSGSVNIQIDYYKNLAQYWKEKAEFWKQQYANSRK